MKSYTIAKASGAPDRDAIEPLRVGCVLWEPGCGVRMEQKLCYDDTALYVFQRAWESDIRAECSAPLSPVHEDSCMEFFFSLADDGRYVNFEINPNACIELGFGPNRRERVRLCHKSERETFRPVCTRTPDGWTAEYRIPLSFLRILYPEFSLRSGVSFRANCYKCGDKTVHPHFPWPGSQPIETKAQICVRIQQPVPHPHSSHLCAPVQNQEYMPFLSLPDTLCAPRPNAGVHRPRQRD